MTFTLYDSTIVPLKGILATLSHILHQAENTHPNPTVLLEARLHDDMYPLPDQIRLATQYSETIAARLTDREPVMFENNLTSFAKFHERIDMVLKTLDEADKEIVNSRGDVLSPTFLGPGKTVEMSAGVFVHSVALPNVYFHLVTAYGILRKEGVEVGKKDYYMGFFPEEASALDVAGRGD